jgi:hypothetical protein
MTLTTIGLLGNLSVYVDLTREQAIERYNRENESSPFDPEVDTVKEWTVKDGKFYAYDLWV